MAVEATLEVRRYFESMNDIEILTFNQEEALKFAEARGVSNHEASKILVDVVESRFECAPSDTSSL